MADKPYQKKKIQDTAGSDFGNYQEGVGGGASPNGKSSPGDHGHGVNSDYRSDNNDTMQPRTGDGKFTYKSVNGESINPKYGPSRGKTVNPLLTGGQNGIMIDDVESDFASESGNYWDKYKDSWYQKGSEVVTKGDFKVRVSAEAVWNVAKRMYDKVKGEFQAESNVFDETKKGRRGKEEKAAIQKAKANDTEQGVISQKTGGLKLKPGTPKLQPKQVHIQAPQPKPQPKPGIQPAPTPVAPQQPNVVQEKQEAISQPQNAPKYTPEEFKAAREAIKGEFQKAGMEYDPMFDDDEILSEYLDQNGGKELFSYDEPESEAEKKVKAMGFSA